MKHVLKPLLISFALIMVFSNSKDNIINKIKTVQESYIYTEAGKDFVHFTYIVKDMLNYVKTGDSDYSSGLKAILGLDKSEDEDAIADSSNEAKKVELEEVTLVHISDGDTVTVLASDGYEYRVRLIGIDTPESVNPNENKNNEYGSMASEHTKEILESISTLYLEYDLEKTDMYGRLLAYVWLTDNTDDIANMLNARILAEGYAINKTYEPNTKYADIFSSIRIGAENSGNGLWAYEGYKELIKES